MRPLWDDRGKGFLMIKAFLSDRPWGEALLCIGISLVLVPLDWLNYFLDGASRRVDRTCWSLDTKSKQLLSVVITYKEKEESSE